MNDAIRKIGRLPRWLACQLIALYRFFISPLLGNNCRFSPSCSQYADQVLRERGLIRGLPRVIWRLLRCHPFSRGGYDPPVKQRSFR